MMSTILGVVVLPLRKRLRFLKKIREKMHGFFFNKLRHRTSLFIFKNIFKNIFKINLIYIEVLYTVLFILCLSNHCVTLCQIKILITFLFFSKTYGVMICFEVEKRGKAWKCLFLRRERNQLML